MLVCGRDFFWVKSMEVQECLQVPYCCVLGTLTSLISVCHCWFHINWQNKLPWRGVYSAAGCYMCHCVFLVCDRTWGFGCMYRLLHRQVCKDTHWKWVCVCVGNGPCHIYTRFQCVILYIFDNVADIFMPPTAQVLPHPWKGTVTHTTLQCCKLTSLSRELRSATCHGTTGDTEPPTPRCSWHLESLQAFLYLYAFDQREITSTTATNQMHYLWSLMQYRHHYYCYDLSHSS